MEGGGLGEVVLRRQGSEKGFRPYCALCCVSAARCDLACCSLSSVPYITLVKGLRAVARASYR